MEWRRARGVQGSHASMSLAERWLWWWCAGERGVSAVGCSEKGDLARLIVERWGPQGGAGWMK